MVITPDSNEFWDCVDREMRLKNPTTWSLTKWMLRLGIGLVLLAASYWMFLSLLPPTRGFYVTQYELTVHPIIWALVGTIFIIGGAYLRFRAMGPIVEYFKRHGFD